ncbi:MAG: elongation factor P hydroxylase [Pseudomonadota bacterium]
MCSGKAADAHALTALFNCLFADAENTVLIGGADEPLYEPGDGGALPARIYFRADFAASALHETAHWCIAGAERRRCTDYGYWYSPDGRGSDAQRRFLEVESRPQALEWAFALACGRSFRLSLDNLDAPTDTQDQQDFVDAVCEEARRVKEGHCSKRAQRFMKTLAAEFRPEDLAQAGGDPLKMLHFKRADLTS